MKRSKSIVSEAARILGAVGGRVKSARKTKAVRLNGKKGGRPKKVLDKQNG